MNSDELKNQEPAWHCKDVRIFDPLSGHDDWRKSMRLVVVDQAKRERVWSRENNIKNLQICG